MKILKNINPCQVKLSQFIQPSQNNLFIQEWEIYIYIYLLSTLTSIENLTMSLYSAHNT